MSVESPDQDKIAESRDSMLVNFEMACIERNIEPDDEKRVLYLLGIVHGIDICKQGYDEAKKGNLNANKAE